MKDKVNVIIYCCVCALALSMIGIAIGVCIGEMLLTKYCYWIMAVSLVIPFIAIANNVTNNKK